MADNSPPPMIRRALSGGGGAASMPKIKNFGMAGFHQASLPHSSAAGGGGMRGGGGKLSAGGLGGGQGLGAGFGGGESGDPVMNGNFEQAGRLRIYGIPIGSPQLSERGQAQKATSERIQAFSQNYLSQIQQGLTPHQAFAAAVKQQPNALMDLMQHPTALRSLDQLTQVLAPAGPQQTFSGVSKQGQQVVFDETGKAVGINDVPGFKSGQEEGAGTGKTFNQTYQKPGGGQGTRQMQYQRGPNGLLTAVPVEGSEGEVKLPASAAAKSGLLAPSDIAGLPPQVTADIPKTAFNRQNMNALEATPTVMAALDRMKQASEGMGLVKGPIAALSGEYFGLNGTGAQFKADMDLIRTQAPLIMGSGYKAAVESFMTGIGSTNNAPSFLKLQASQMQTAMRNRAQEMADAETTSHQGKLPPSLANGLISQGVVPNGYQDQRTLDQLPAGQAALWKARFAPTALNAEDRATLFTDAANGKFGPIAQPGEDLKNILQIHQTYKAQQAAKTQQGTASAAAVSANAPAQVAPVVSGQPAETPEAGAQQPQQPAQQGQAQPPADQQQPEQQGNQPQAQGQQPPQDATQQNAQVQDATQLAPGGALMPPTAVPGQPATLVPGTNGATPLPQPNPLPQISQTLTPQGGVPTPASQAPVQNTTQPDLQGQVDAELDKVNRERTPGGLMSNNPQMGSQEGQRVPLPAPPVPPQAPPPAPSPYTPIFGGM